MTVAGLLSALAVLAALLAIYRVWSRWPLDVIGLFTASFVLFYGARAVIVGFGLDELFPDYLFSTGSSATVRANLVLVLFLVAVMVGIAAGNATRAKGTWFFPTFDQHPAPRRYLLVATLLTLLSTAIALTLMSRFGGFSGLLRAGKIDKDLAGLYFLNIAPDTAAMVSAACFLDTLRRRERRLTPGQRVRALSSAGLALLNGVWVFAFGARSVLAIVAFVLLAGSVTFGARGDVDRTSRRRLWMRLALVGVVAATVIVGLRFARDIITRGEPNKNLADQSLLRQASVASNATTYDAYVLAVRDWPRAHAYRGGEDFYIGATAVVPRALWSDKPANVVPGRWFRQVYEPAYENGWPMGAVGEWYLNFGLAGVAAGGLVTGALLGLAARALRNAKSHPLAFVATGVICLQVLDTGFGSQTALKWVTWCLPLMLVGPALGARRVVNRRTRGHVAQQPHPAPGSLGLDALVQPAHAGAAPPLRRGPATGVP